MGSAVVGGGAAEPLVGGLDAGVVIRDTSGIAGNWLRGIEVGIVDWGCFVLGVVTIVFGSGGPCSFFLRLKHMVGIERQTPGGEKNSSIIWRRGDSG